MGRTFVSTWFSTIAVALALCGAARADASGPEAAGPPGAAAVPASAQARIVDATLRLERTFSSQFVNGHVDRAALAPLVDDAVHAFPQALQAPVEAHVARVIDAGQRLATELTPDRRAQIASAPAPAALEQVLMTVVNPWGVPIAGEGSLGWGGLGAFGFPDAYNCIPYSAGYAVPYGGLGWNGYTTGFSAGNYSSLTCGGGYGYGLGLGGWGW
jgi:hypothetical protein